MNQWEIPEAQRGDIPEPGRWAVVRPIREGWSSDRKFYLEDREGRKRLLRLSAPGTYERKREEFEALRRFNQFDFPMSHALEWGMTDTGTAVYTLLTWVEGRPLLEAMAGMSEAEQYRLGVQAGMILREMHTLRTDPDPAWSGRMKDKIRNRLEAYERCPARVEGDRTALAFVKSRMDWIDDPQLVQQHGDFHAANLLLTPEGRIGVIDFNRWDTGDAAEEFYKLQVLDRERSVPFSQGRLKGYFGGEPPETFWRRLAVYTAYACLYSIVWAIPYGEADVEGMQMRCRLALDDYEGFTQIIPRWYRADG